MPEEGTPEYDWLYGSTPRTPPGAGRSPPRRDEGRRGRLGVGDAAAAQADAARQLRRLRVEPLPAPGQGPAPKPVTLPAGKLRDALGIREVSYTKGQQSLALKDQKLT